MRSYVRLTENELYMKEEYGEAEWNVTGQRVEGNMVMYSCEQCGFLHPFIKRETKEVRKGSHEEIQEHSMEYSVNSICSSVADDGIIWEGRETNEYISRYEENHSID